jgi:hypothetical protein
VNWDWVCHDAPKGRTFAAFNCGRLTDEPITDADILPIHLVKNSNEANETWSSGLDWYFKNTDAGIILARPGADTGLICLKKSWKFLEAFLDAPL